MDNNNYYQMSHLPFAMTPTGPGSLGNSQKMELRKKYPPPQFYNRENRPMYYHKGCYRPLDSGLSENPNIYSSFGVINPDDLM
jgi:hypothetical protein